MATYRTDKAGMAAVPVDVAREMVEEAGTLTVWVHGVTKSPLVESGPGIVDDIAIEITQEQAELLIDAAAKRSPGNRINMIWTADLRRVCIGRIGQVTA